MRPYMLAMCGPYALPPAAENVLRPLQSFRECAKDCPEMIVVPAGSFIMGSPEHEKGRFANEGPQRKVTISRPFAVSKFLVTFDDWDTCVSVGGCPHAPELRIRTRHKASRECDLARSPAVCRVVLENDRPALSAVVGGRMGICGARRHIHGLPLGRRSRTGQCQLQRVRQQMGQSGDVSSRIVQVQCVRALRHAWQRLAMGARLLYRPLRGAPTDGSARTDGDCSRRVVRGGSSNTNPAAARAAFRSRDSVGFRLDYLGFRIARTLGQ